jgi:hypothetical protein
VNQQQTARKIKNIFTGLEILTKFCISFAVSNTQPLQCTADLQKQKIIQELEI